MGDQSELRLSASAGGMNERGHRSYHSSGNVDVVVAMDRKLMTQRVLPQCYWLTQELSSGRRRMQEAARVH